MGNRINRTPSDRYYGDPNEGDANNFAINSVNEATEAVHYQTKQSRRLPPKFWLVCSKLLGIKLSDDEKPWIGYLTFGITVIFSLLFLISYSWYTIALFWTNLKNREREPVLTGLISIAVVLYWVSLSVYGRLQASRILSSRKFVESVRMHSRSIFKMNAAVLLVLISIVALVINNYDSATTFSDAHCSKHNVTVDPIICKLMYISRVGCSFFTLLWNLTIGVVLLSVSRTHTIGG